MLSWRQADYRCSDLNLENDVAQMPENKGFRRSIFHFPLSYLKIYSSVHGSRFTVWRSLSNGQDCRVPVLGS